MDYKDRKKFAYKLRKSGYSYSYINEKTGVSKSTLSNWFTLLEYTPNKETLRRIGSARIASAEQKKKIKQKSIYNAEIQARADIGTITKRDLMMIGVGLYIGEGTKTANVIRIVNSNPKVIKLAIRWFIEVVGLSMDNITLRMYLYPDNDEVLCRKFWMKETGLTKKSILKTQFDSRKNKKMSKKNKLPYGTVHLGIRSLGNKNFGVYLFRRIMAWQNEVL